MNKCNICKRKAIYECELCLRKVCEDCYEAKHGHCSCKPEFVPLKKT